jgi:Macrocin-O-methyltransferase (TylF)
LAASDDKHLSLLGRLKQRLPGRSESERTALGFARTWLVWRIWRVLEQLPRPSELRDPRCYWRGARLARRMRRGGYSMVGARRARALVRLANVVERERVPGVIVDCGVWNGGSTIMMSVAAPTRTVWAFDSFEGMPEAGQFDPELAHQLTGEARGSEAKVRQGFEQFSNPQRLRVANGWFEDTFPAFADQIDEVAMLHIDADWYESVRLALETFYPRLAPGGYCAVDDYNFWSGTRRAVDEFRAKRQISAPIVSNHYWSKSAGEEQAERAMAARGSSSRER